ncbi:MAG: heavy metal translocating P-type ATPase [Aquabacterium sp.]
MNPAAAATSVAEAPRAGSPAAVPPVAAVGSPVQVQLQLWGLHCVACAGLIQDALIRVPGVHAATVQGSVGIAQVDWAPAGRSSRVLIQAIEAAGYGAGVAGTADAAALRQREARRTLWQLFVASFCAMQVMMLAAPAYVAEPGDLAPDLARLLALSSWMLTLPVLAFSAGPFFSGAWRGLRARRIGMDLPVALGIAVTFVASSAAAFQPDGILGAEVYFDSLTMFVSLLLLSRWLQQRAAHRAAADLESRWGGQAAQATRLLADGRQERVDTAELQAGDRLRVAVGEVFASDGLIEQGRTRVDEALLSGEAVPVDKAPGSNVIAGSLNLGAPVDVQVVRCGADTELAAILRQMRQALDARPEVARLADRWAGPFLWVVLIAAALGGLAWSVIDPARAPWVVVSVLIVTCPCALSLAVPSALLAASGRAARNGLLLKRITMLEDLWAVSHVVLDKTGTVTEDGAALVPHWLGGAVPVGGMAVPAPGDALAAAVVLAGQSAHVLSRRLVSLPCDPLSTALHDVTEEAGAGLQAIDDQGRVWRLGSLAWVAGVGAAASDASPDGGRVWLSCDRQVLMHFDDGPERLRPDAADAVAAWKAMGLGVTLLSGDATARVAAAGAALGVDHVVAAARPQDKLAHVRRLQAQGERVLMVGDGLNDAPVLAQADVSVACGAAVDASRRVADAVLVSGRLMDLVRARHLAGRTRRVIRQNLVWSAVYNAACIPLALAGWLPPLAAGIGMAASSLLVALNALRLSR